MQIALFLFFGFIAIVPGLLLLLASYRFKKRVHQPTAILVLLGSIFILFHLLVDSGTYYFSFLGTAESLASYALTKSWLSPAAQYIGLIMIASGLLLYKKES